jgi:mannitol-specific phosphotransferase system IIBC component
MTTIEMLNRFFAGVIAVCCGLVAFAVTYYLVGFITEPLKEWIKNKALEGVRIWNLLIP